MPIVRIDLFPGRSPELKRELAQRMTDLFSEVAAIAPDATTILFNDVAREEWFVGGRSYADAAPPAS